MTFNILLRTKSLDPIRSSVKRFTFFRIATREHLLSRAVSSAETGISWQNTIMQTFSAATRIVAKKVTIQTVRTDADMLQYVPVLPKSPRGNIKIYSHCDQCDHTQSQYKCNWTSVLQIKPWLHLHHTHHTRSHTGNKHGRLNTGNPLY